MSEPRSTSPPAATRLGLRARPRIVVGTIATTCALVALLLAAFGAQGSSRSEHRPHRLAWIVNFAAVRGIARRDPGLAAHFFNTPATFITLPPGQSSPEPRATSTASFASEAALQTAIDAHALAPGIRAIVYDSEDWAATPVAEQLNPAKYYRLAAAAAHRDRLRLIATPAPDLVTRLDPSAGTRQKYTAFVRLKVAAAAARYADVYEIQAQGAEIALPKYVSFIRAVAAQARRAHPGIEVLAGISTNPGGVRQAGSVLFGAVQATRGIVAGYWLNDPAGGSFCPRCTGPFPDVAVDLLRRLRASGS